MGADQSTGFPRLFRLEVWRYSEIGLARNQKDNDDLAKLFARDELQDWDVEKVDSAKDESGSDPKDRYGPVAVGILFQILTSRNTTTA